MHSSQINFYLNQKDSVLLDLKLAKAENIVFLNQQSDSEVPNFLSNTLIENMGKERLKIALARRSDLHDLVFRRMKGSRKFRLDTFSSPVIEYSRCFVSDELIRRGRLYSVNSFYGESRELIKKPMDFLKWRKMIFEIAKRGLVKDSFTNYSGGGALMDERNGKKLVSI